MVNEDKKLTKVYTYTRVSTEMQVDGYSLDAQMNSIRNYAKALDFEIVREYEDAGVTGTSTTQRFEFQQMMNDIKSEKDDVKFVLVFKLSRFGRNVLDVLESLEVMQSYDVNLISIQDGIDSSKEVGRLMITIMASIAEMERENIVAQSMAGRKQKAREGKWNGGMAPYGYDLVDGKLVINEAEAEGVRKIFDEYVNTRLGATGVARKLAESGIKKIPRGQGVNTLFSSALVRRIVNNPVYSGNIAYGRRKREKIKGTRDQYVMRDQKDYEIFKGIHEPIVSEEMFQKAQRKINSLAYKYSPANRNENVYLLSGLLVCPSCGYKLYGSYSSRKREDGTYYDNYFYYQCKNRKHQHGHKCEFKKAVNLKLINKAVEEVVFKLVSNEEFIRNLENKINIHTNVFELEKEIENLREVEKEYIFKKDRLASEIDYLNIDEEHYELKRADLQERYSKMYNLLSKIQNKIADTVSKKEHIEKDTLNKENILKILRNFNKLYVLLDDFEKRELIVELIKEVHIYDEKQENGQWLKSIAFLLPIIDERVEIQSKAEGLVSLLARINEDAFIEVKLRLGSKQITSVEAKVTYKQIQDYVFENYNVKVSHLNIAQTKRINGIIERSNYNLGKKGKRPNVTKDKQNYIELALKQFKMI